MNAHALNSTQNIVCSGIQDALEQEKLQGSEIQMSWLHLVKLLKTAA